MAINNKPVKLEEKSRTYYFPREERVILTNVTEFQVSSSGNHRLKANGKLHIVPTGWLHIEIDADDWTV